MGITGQVSLARVGQNVRILEQTSDIIDVFDPNSTPALQAQDHVTLYPGDFRQALSANPITIPENVFLTILPGAIVQYGNIRGPLATRYENINGAIENIADLNIADQYTTQVEQQFPRVRVYPEQVQTQTGESVPFSGFDSLDEAATAAQPGDTVVVFPGDYFPTSNLFVDNVTWKFLEGSIIEYKPEFSSTYPHALFDDLKSVDGEDDPGGKTCRVFGDAEFIIGTQSAQPTSFATFDSSTTSAADWEEWHMYSVLGVNNSSSTVDFEAKRIRMENFADAAVKLSATDEVSVDVETVEMTDTLDLDQDISTVAGEVPTFCVINGILPSLTSGEIDVNVGNLEMNTSASTLPVYFVTGLNHDTQNRNPYEGSIEISASEVETPGPQFNSTFINFSSETSPEKLIIDETTTLENNSSIFLESSAAGPTTKFVLKNSEISTVGNVDRPPLVLSGDPDGFDINLSEVWLLSGPNANQAADFAIQNNTGSTDFEIKVYGDSFADAPVQDYQQILNDVLDNIAWSEDVNSLS